MITSRGFSYAVCTTAGSNLKELRGMIQRSSISSTQDLMNADNAPFLYSIIFSNDHASYDIYNAKLNLGGNSVIRIILSGRMLYQGSFHDGTLVR